MKSWAVRIGRITLTLVVAIVAVLALLGGKASAQSNPYRLVEGWAKLSGGRTFGAVIAAAVDRNGNVWAFERCGGDTCAGSTVAPILQFDPSGKLLKSFGAGMFVYPHGFHVDSDGNVWATDGEGKGGKGYQVFKFSPEGKVLLTLGKAGISADASDTFIYPSAVVVAPNGDIFVADGHNADTNGRIMKFSRDGKLIKSWGRKGAGPVFERDYSVVVANCIFDRCQPRIESHCGVYEDLTSAISVGFIAWLDLGLAVSLRHDVLVVLAAGVLHQLRVRLEYEGIVNVHG